MIKPSRQTKISAFWFASSSHWFIVYVIILASWCMLWLFTVSSFHHHEFTLSLASFLNLLISTHIHNADFGILFGMWVTMSAGMMLPGFIPVLRTYDDLRSTGSGSFTGFVMLIAGYLAVWIGYSLVMSWIQFSIVSSELPALTDIRSSWIITVGLLLAAGFYQLSQIKDACLLRCRNPLLIFIARGEQGTVGSFLTGGYFGIWCVGCCWLLMTICLIGGLMSVVWMGLATVMITLEKLPLFGKYSTWGITSLLFGGSLWVMGKNLI